MRLGTRLWEGVGKRPECEHQEFWEIVVGSRYSQGTKRGQDLRRVRASTL